MSEPIYFEVNGERFAHPYDTIGHWPLMGRADQPVDLYCLRNGVWVYVFRGRARFVAGQDAIAWIRGSGLELPGGLESRLALMRQPRPPHLLDLMGAQRFPLKCRDGRRERALYRQTDGVWVLAERHLPTDRKYPPGEWEWYQITPEEAIRLIEQSGGWSWYPADLWAVESSWWSSRGGAGLVDPDTPVIVSTRQTIASENLPEPDSDKGRPRSESLLNRPQTDRPPRQETQQPQADAPATTDARDQPVESHEDDTPTEPAETGPEAEEPRPEKPTRAYCLLKDRKDLFIRWKGKKKVEPRFWLLLGKLLDLDREEVGLDKVKKGVLRNREHTKTLRNAVRDLSREHLRDISFPWEYSTDGTNIIRHNV
jgi:hypothetical protein